MCGLQHPAGLQGQAVIVGGVELVASIRHACDFPAAHAIVHAYLGVSGDAPFTPAWRHDTNDLSRSPLFVVRLVLLRAVVRLRLDDHEIIGPETVPGVEGSCEASRGARREQGERNDLVDRLGPLS